MNQSSTADAELMTADEVAIKLRCCPRFVRRLVSERRIEYVKVGRSVNFRPSAVDDYIERNRFPPLTRAELRDSILAGV